MKKVYALTTLFLFSVFPLFAQEKITAGKLNAKPVSAVQKITPNPSPMVIDTLQPPSIGSGCDTGWVYYTLDASPPNDTGYAFGNNVYGETECSQRFLVSGNIQEVLVLYGAVAATPNGTNTVKIYSTNPTDKKPQTVLGTSNTVPMVSVVTTAYTSYTFGSPVAVTNDFHAAVVFPTTPGDTVAVASTYMGCFVDDSLSWENFPTFGGWGHTPLWFSFPYNPNMNLDLIIFPVVDLTTGINDFASSGSLILYGAFPNPASDITTIQYELANADHVFIEVFDLSGKALSKFSSPLSSGKHELKLDLKNYSSGNYYYSVQTHNGKLTSRFSVVK